MGADAFVAFYGIKFPLDPDNDDELDACGLGTDWRCRAAAESGLESHSGRMTDGEDYFLFVGERLAWLGLEHDSYSSVNPMELSETMERVAAKLRDAGFSQSPSLHLQFVGQY